MPPPEPGHRLMPSLLNRLTDPDSMGTTSAPGYDDRDMMLAVRADLEELLNTRLTAVNVPPEFAEVRGSIVTYGLPDLVTFNGTSADHCAELARAITAVIGRYEPRLRNVRVTVVRGKAADPRSARFHIEAALNVDPAPEVGFETVLELTTGRATVNTDGERR